MTDDMTNRMRQAIAAAHSGNTPFGAVLVDSKGRVVSAYNSTGEDGATAHAEMNVLGKLKQLNYTDCKELTLYTTAEPCPMCMGAIIWSGIGNVVYGASIAQLSKIIKQIEIPCQTLADHSWYQPTIVGGVLETELLELFRQYM